MKKILFFKIDVFEVIGYKSIEVKNLKEIEDFILKGEVSFIIFPEGIEGIEEIVSYLRNFLFQNKTSSYTVLIQEAESDFRVHGGFVKIKKQIIPKMIERLI